MKKLFNLILMLALASFFVSAQSSFRKVYSPAAGFSGYPLDIVETTNSNFLLLSAYGPNVNLKNNILLNKIDGNGNLVWSREIALSSDHLEPMLIADLNENGCLLVTHGDVRWTDSTLFIQLDTSGNLMGIQAIANFQPDLFCFNPSDSSILMKMDHTAGDVLLVNYDIHGFIRWAKTLNEPNGVYCNYRSIHPLSNGGYLIYGEYEKGCVVIKIDSSGGVVYNRIIEPADTLTYLISLDMVSPSESSIVISYIVSRNQISKVGCMLMDSTGTPVKNKTFYYPLTTGFWNLYGRNGELYTMIGSHTTLENWFSAILQLDSSLNFQRLVSLSDTNFNEYNGPIYCGSVLLFTSTTDDPTESYIINKTDSLNHLVCSGYDFNMTEDSLLLNYSLNNFSTSPFTISLGPNLTNIYINPVTVNVRDYCGTLLSTPEVHPINFSVFPNPTSERTIKIAFTSQNNYSCVVELFDLSGRMIYNTQFEVLSGDNQKEITLNNLEPGIYFIVLDGPAGKRSLKFVKE